MQHPEPPRVSAMRVQSHPFVLELAPVRQALEGMSPVLEAQGLTLHLETPAGRVRVLQQVQFVLKRGGSTCLVGPSGSGKSQLCRVLLGLVRPPPGGLTGQLRFYPSSGPAVELLDPVNPAAYPAAFEPLWGNVLGYVPQHAARVLDSTRNNGALLTEAIHRRRRGSPTSYPRLALEAEALEWLEQLGLPEPRRVLAQRPTALSGGMAQRLAIALALARGAKLLVADEPTAGLDPDARQQLLILLQKLRQAGHLETLLLITHDLQLAETLADEVAVMSAGQVVEQLPVSSFFRERGPQHPAALKLLAGYQALQHPRHRTRAVGEGTKLPPSPEPPPSPELPPSPHPPPRLEVVGLRAHYGSRAAWPWQRRERTSVLEGLNLTLPAGQVVGMFGPSGAGKSTLAACLVGLTRPQAGTIKLDGVPFTPQLQQEHTWRALQLVHQPVEAALHPQLTVLEGLLETAQRLLKLPPPQARQQVEAVMERLRLLGRTHARPGTLSGGELRRVGLARAVLVRPRVLIADEPTAGVDVSLCAAVLDELLSLSRGPEATAVLLISHDRQVLRYASDVCWRLEAGRLWPAVEMLL